MSRWKDPIGNGIWLTDSCFGNLVTAEQHDVLLSQGFLFYSVDDDDRYPLSPKECFILPGEGGFAFSGEIAADILFGSSYWLNGKKYFLPLVEFHYRNDDTRRMWGTPVTLEENLPSMFDQTKLVKKSFARVYSKLEVVGGDAFIEFREHVQPNGQSTDDRHILYLMIPCEFAIHRFENAGSFLKWVRDLFD